MEYTVGKDPNAFLYQAMKLEKSTCKELNTKLRSGCVGNEPGGISEKHPARTWTQECFCYKQSQRFENLKRINDMPNPASKTMS